MSLTLYYHPLASYCQKVLVALYENGTEFDKRLIDLGNEADRAELAAIWPFARFPVIRDHLRHRDIAESTIIIEYLDRFFGGAAPLLPDNWEQALEVRMWDRFFDTYVHTPMQAIVADRITGAQGDLAKERASLNIAYGMLEERMASQRWAAGEQFSMADCAAAPSLFYAVTVHPFPPGAVHLPAYFERLMARPSMARVIDEARPYFAMYPFREGLDARFLPPA